MASSLDCHTKQFLIRTRSGASAPSDQDVVRQAILYVGGEPTGDAYSFVTAHHLDVAMQLLTEQFGPCFVVEK